MLSPVRLVDPDGRSVEETDDWVLRNGKIVWDSNVTGKNDPNLNGAQYIGKEDESIVKYLFGKTWFETSEITWGSISPESSSNGSAYRNVTFSTTIMVNLSADISNSSDDKVFNGIVTNQL